MIGQGRNESLSNSRRNLGNGLFVAEVEVRKVIKAMRNGIWILNKGT